MWLYTVFIPCAISVLVGGMLLVRSQKISKVFLWEYLVLICPIFIWNLMAIYSIGSQSLSNISEVYLVVLAIIIYSFARLKKIDMKPNQKCIGMIVLLILPIAMRFLFPSLPE